MKQIEFCLVSGSNNKELRLVNEAKAIALEH